MDLTAEQKHRRGFLNIDNWKPGYDKTKDLEGRKDPQDKKVMIFVSEDDQSATRFITQISQKALAKLHEEKKINIDNTVIVSSDNADNAVAAIENGLEKKGWDHVDRIVAFMDKNLRSSKFHDVLDNVVAKLGDWKAKFLYFLSSANFGAITSLESRRFRGKKINHLETGLDDKTATKLDLRVEDQAGNLHPAFWSIRKNNFYILDDWQEEPKVKALAQVFDRMIRMTPGDDAANRALTAEEVPGFSNSKDSKTET